MAGWAEFLKETNQYYGVDMSVLSDGFRDEQRDYYLATSSWMDIHPSQLLGPPSRFKEYDLLTVTIEELAQPLKVWGRWDALPGVLAVSLMTHLWPPTPSLAMRTDAGAEMRPQDIAEMRILCMAAK
jgi:hypothetical protein